jgi:hypothetical protein
LVRFDVADPVGDREPDRLDGGSLLCTAAPGSQETDQGEAGRGPAAGCHVLSLDRSDFLTPPRREGKSIEREGFVTDA